MLKEVEKDVILYFSFLSSLIATGITSSILVKNSLTDRRFITAVDDMTVYNKKPELDHTRFENVSVNVNALTCNQEGLQQRTLTDIQVCLDISDWSGVAKVSELWRIPSY